MKFETLSATAEATDLIVNNQKQRLYIIFFASYNVDRSSIKKTTAGFFAALNSADASTVYRHNKGNFSHLPVRDTLSTYPSAGLKSEKSISPCGFIVCVRTCVRLANDLSRRRGGWQEQARWKYYKKNTGKKNQPTQKKGGKRTKTRS